MSQMTKALLLALEQWVLRATPPPDSVYPTLAAGTLAPANAIDLGYPLTALLPLPDGIANPLLVYDLGPDFKYNDLSGVVSSRPSKITGVIPAMAPKVDADGNELGGIHTVLQQAALGTYLGWNLTSSGFAKGQLCALSGSFIPFAETKAERIARGDTRLSLEERYGTQRGYMCVVTKAVSSLRSQRFLLDDDGEALLRSASASKILPGDSEGSGEAKRIADVACTQQAR